MSSLGNYYIIIILVVVVAAAAVVVCVVVVVAVDVVVVVVIIIIVINETHSDPSKLMQVQAVVRQAKCPQRSVSLLLLHKVLLEVSFEVLYRP